MGHGTDCVGGACGGGRGGSGDCERVQQFNCEQWHWQRDWERDEWWVLRRLGCDGAWDWDWEWERECALLGFFELERRFARWVRFARCGRWVSGLG